MNEEIREVKYETKKVVRAGYEQFHSEAVAKLENVEEEARRKVEEMIREDKETLEKIIDLCTEEIQVPVEEPETTEEETSEEIIGE